MSKESRRQQRVGSTTPKPASPPATGGRAPSSSPTSTPRAGRRERARYSASYQASFAERYRTAIVAVVVVAAVALIGGFVFVSASRAAFTCATIWSPAPTASPAAGASNPPGYTQPDMGNRHVPYGTVVTYQYCAPASGPHYNQSGTGPIAPRVYGPDDTVIPQGWVHNLEHGALVLLYKGTSEGATPAGQLALKAFYDAFPNSPVCNFERGTVGPVIARFDKMETDYSAIVWGRVLPMTTLDLTEILDFYATWGEKTNPEQQCTPTPSPTVEPSASPSAGPSAPASSPSPEPSASPS